MTLSVLPLAIILLLHIPSVYSLLPSHCNGTSATTLDVSDFPPCSNNRSLWDIIWSCAATLFACTWTAIHPNIPGMDEGKFTAFSRRLGIMTVTLVAPEVTITWAAIQFLSARDNTKAFNDAFGVQIHQVRSDHLDIGESAATVLDESLTSDRRNSPHPSAPHDPSCTFKEWTVTHGFFAWMGGFMLYFNGKPRATLTPMELQRFVNEGSVQMPVITEADIEDRSKGDALSKGIAILQLGWFVLYLIARYVQNLPITLLELDTLAVAALTCISYGFWWKKPKDIGRPHAVYWKATVPPPSELTYDKVDEIFSTEDWASFFLTYLYPLPSFMGVGIFNSPHAVHSRRVPSAGGYDVGDAHRHRFIMLFTGCFSGAVFGGMHCLGWSVLFQGRAEQILWRAASLAIVSAPVSIFVLNSYAIWLGHFWLDHFWLNDSWVDQLGEAVAFFVIFASFFSYVIARVTLIVLILMSFRSLPPGVYDTVAWTEFIPHL